MAVICFKRIENDYRVSIVVPLHPTADSRLHYNCGSGGKRECIERDNTTTAAKDPLAAAGAARSCCD